MGDPLLERTRRLLTDYLTFCAREPGTPEPPPGSTEAALLRTVAAEVQENYQEFFSSFLGYQGNRLEVVTRMVDVVLSDDQHINWGRLVLVLTFAGTLLSQGPCKVTRQKKSGLRRNQSQVTRDCQLIVDFLCSRILGQHRSWLEDQDGWDGFCDFFKSPFPLRFGRLVIKTLLYCIIATAVLYAWKQFRF
ncbi:bcl-2-like protein 10 [Peromyscus eremicus]|uniref:bcl-2-like protein 10 n=1 Tax=Peromyscus eremicus TaxID=42410 RepID=UPI0027DB8AFF|nr:bcl-2-like protein 10 [Peromyscus eremicus]